MDTPKKVLIFYASAGHGHEKAAYAVLEAIEEKYPGVSAVIVDAIALMPSFVGKAYRRTYLVQIKYFPLLWGAFYYLLDIRWIYFFLRPVRRLFNAAISRRLCELVAREKPDAVFTTHFFAAEVVSDMKEKGRTQGRLVTVVTDYFPHYIWTASGVDRYAVALSATGEELVRRGAPAGLITVTGIPVEKKFLKPLLRDALLKELDLEPGIFTVLLTSGGIGMGAVGPVVKKLLTLEKPVQVLMVCGTNEKLYREMSDARSTYPRLRTFGFVSNMNELMEAADIVIGKAGGLTITESFSKGKPVILTGSIPGQEARNVACVKAHAAGVEARNPYEVAAIVSRFLSSPQEITLLKKGVAEIARPKAAASIAALAQA